MTDTTQIVYLDCNRQNSKKSEANTNEWEYKIGDEAMVLPPGTQISIQNALINKRGLSGGSIIIDEDIKEEMAYHYYKSDNECWRPAAQTPVVPTTGSTYTNIYNATRGEHLNPDNKFCSDADTNTVNDGVYAGLGKKFRQGGNDVPRYDNTKARGEPYVVLPGSSSNHFYPNNFGDTRGITQYGETLLQDYRRVGLSETPMMAMTTKTWGKKVVNNVELFADDIDQSEDPTLPYDPTTSTYFVPRVGTSTIFIPKGTYGISELAQLITDQVNGKLVDVESGNFNKSAYEEKLIEIQGKEGARESLDIAGLGNNRTYIRVLPEAIDETGEQTDDGLGTVIGAAFWQGYKPTVGGWVEKNNLSRPFNVPQFSYCSSYTASWDGTNAAAGSSTLWLDDTGTHTASVAGDPPNDGLIVFAKAIDKSQFNSSGKATKPESGWTNARTEDANGITQQTKFLEFNGYLFIPFTQEVIKYERRKFHNGNNAEHLFLGFHGLTRGCYGTTARPIPRGVLIEKYQCAAENRTSEYDIPVGHIYRTKKWQLPDEKAGIFTDTYHFNKMCKTLITPPNKNTNTITTIRKTRMNLLCSQQLQDKTQMNPPSVAYPPADNSTPVWSPYQNYPNSTAGWVGSQAAGEPNNGKGFGATITDLNGGFNYKACRDQMPLQYIRPQKSYEAPADDKPNFFSPTYYALTPKDTAGTCLNLNNTAADYDPSRQGYYIGTPEFNLSYDSSSSSYVVNNLHQSWRIPDYDNYGNEIENGGETAVLLRRVCDMAKSNTIVNRDDPFDQSEGNTNSNIERIAEELVDSIEQPKQREGGIAVFNWATLAAREYGDKDWTNPEVYNQDMVDLLEWEDYFTTKQKAKEAWKKTLWGRIGFRYEQLQDRDFYEQNKHYDRPIDESVRVRGTTTRADVDMSSAPSVATSYNPSVKPKIPNKPQDPIAPRTYDNMDINTTAMREGTNDKWIAYGNSAALLNKGVQVAGADDNKLKHYTNTASFFGSFWKYTTASIVLAKGRPIRAYDLPTLSKQGYYIITADILDQHEDSVKKGRNMPLLGVVPLSGEATNDFLNAVEPLTHLISQEKVVNSIKFKVLYPNLMNPDIDENSSVILKIVRPIQPPPQSGGGKSAPEGKSEPPPAKGHTTSASKPSAKKSKT
jgi:hypothetical protein